MATPPGATPVGNNYYLFKSPVPTSECLISAHGGHGRERHFVVPPGVTLHFYAFHGFIQSDPGINFLTDNPIPKETIKGLAGQQVKCHDYGLTKYQGRHNTQGETYGSIQNKVNRTARNIKSSTEAFVRYVSKGGSDEKNIDAMLATMGSYRPIDIVTVRNRTFSGERMLSDLIQKVRIASPGTNVFHCSFCRSSDHYDAGLSQKASGNRFAFSR
ncbi:MAG: putative adhesin [Bacteroidota bacterium]